MADELKENLEQETKPSKKRSKLFWALLASGIGAVIIAVVLLVVFLMPKEEKFDINLGSSGTTSSVVLTGDGSYTKGDSVTIVAQDIEGYRFVNWTYNGNIVSEEREYTFVIGESTQGEYTANYARVYKIKASENQYGTFTINPTSAIAGEEITVEFEIGAEYQDEYTFSDLYYMYNTTENIIENNRFIMPEGDVKIYARLDNLYNINLTSNISDSVEVDLIGEGLYAENASATITAPYVEGYRFRSWTLNDQVVSTNQVYIIENINASTSGTYVANYDSPYQITIKSSSGDIVIDAFENDEMTYQTEVEDIIQDTEIIIQKLQILAGNEEIPYTEENGKFSFIMPASDVVIDVVEDSRLPRITDFMIMGNTIMEYAGNATEIVVPSSYKLYEQETGGVQVYQSFEEFTNHFGGEGNPIVSQLFAGFYYKTKDSNEFVEVTVDEIPDLFSSGQFWNVVNNPNSYPLTIKLKTEYTVTQEIFNSLLDYNDETLISFAILGPFMQVLYSPYLSNLAISFTYQIGDAEPVDADVSNISDMVKEINESLGDGSDLNALLKYIPIKFTNIRYGNNYICEGKEIKITTIEGGFSYNTDITNVTISEGITTISDECFKDCTNLTELSIPSTLTKVGQYTFNGCDSSLYNKDDNGGLYLGNSNNPYVLLVDVDETQGAISSFNVNENCKTIAPYAINNAQTTITLPSSLASINQGAISGSSDGLDLYYSGTIEQWVNINFEGTWHSYPSTNLYINNTLLENVNIDTNVNDWAFAEIGSIKNVNIGENVSYIGDFAFVSCENLNKISFAENSQLTTIGIYTFGGTNLQEVNIPEGVTKIEMAGFATCANLTYVKLPSTLEIIADGAFIECPKLEEISFPENLKTIGMLAFSECSELTTVNFAKNSQLQSIGQGAFSICTNLTNIILPSNLKTIGREAFAATGLTEIVLPASIESMDAFAFAFTPLQKVYFEQGSQLSYLGDNPFLLCYDLTEIKFPSGLTQIGGGMFNHGALSDYSVHYNEYENGFYLGNDENPHMILCTVNDKTVTDFNIHPNCEFIVAYAFRDCVNLTELTIPSNVKQIAYCAFNNCTNLKTVIFEDNSQMTSIDYGTFGDGIFYPLIQGDGIPDQVYVEQNLNIETINLGNNSQVQSIAEDAFEGRSSLKEVDFGANSQITSIGDNAFIDCINLTSITIPAGLTSIGHNVFSYGNSISEIFYQGTSIDQWLNINFGDRISNGNADLYINDELVEEITVNSNIPEYAFDGIKSLKKVTITDGVTSIGDHAFNDCSNLTEITIPASVTSIGDYAFSDCSNLQKITFAEGSQLQSIGFSAFSGCTRLTEISLPSTLTTIESYTFSGCTSLSSITIPETVTSIGSSAFSDCTSLTKISLPSTLTTIEYSLFSGCTNLTSITIPAGVTTIGDNAFLGCYSLAIVYNNSSLNITAGDYQYGHVGEYAYEVVKPGEEAKGRIEEKNNVSYYINGTTKVALSVIDRTVSSVSLEEDTTAINQYAFRGCTNLTSVTIPANVTEIGYWAFDNCTNLTTVTIESDDIYKAAIGTDTWNHAGGLLANATTVKVQKTIVDGEGNVNNYLNSSTFTKTVSEDGFYYIYELKNQSNL